MTAPIALPAWLTAPALPEPEPEPPIRPSGALGAADRLTRPGDGPYAPQMKAALAGLPAYFLGYRNDGQLAPLYAGSDLFVFPSRTDTFSHPASRFACSW